MKTEMPPRLYYSEREMWQRVSDGKPVGCDGVAALLERISRLRQSVDELRDSAALSDESERT